MFFESHKPLSVLSPYVKGVRIIESGEGWENSLLPDTALTMAYVFKGKVNQVENNKAFDLPGAIVSGLRPSPRYVSYQKQTSNMVVQFNEAGVSAFTREPLHYLFEQTLPLDQIFDRYEIERMGEKLSSAVSHKERVDLVNDFLLKSLKYPEQDALVQAAIQKIKAAQGNVSIKELSKDLYISQDAFEKRFRKCVGTGPKRFASLVRMKAVLVKLKKNPVFLDTAYEAGYYDQAHFNREFKVFTGQSPTEYLKKFPLR